MIGLDGEKMSKSKGNLVFVSRLVAAGVDPMAIRWALMSTHYRVDRMWSDEVLNKAQLDTSRVKEALKMTDVAPTAQLLQQITEAISNDLDTPAAIAAIISWSQETMNGSSGGDVTQLRNTLDALLGLTL
jgi:L-cysteine:1D-myo-inositol 2-amino-2-deoxy-alpha-D-glucopyranoside ligase